MLWDFIFHKLVSNDNIPAEELIEMLHIVTGKLAIMRDHFERKIDCRSAGLTLAQAPVFIATDVAVELAKHFFDLGIERI